MNLPSIRKLFLPFGIAALMLIVTFAPQVAGIGLAQGGQSDIAVTLDGPAEADSGEVVTYTAVVSNLGPDPAQGVVVNATDPEGFTTQGATSTRGSCTVAPDPPGPPPPTAGFACALTETLALGETFTATITGTVTGAVGSSYIYQVEAPRPGLLDPNQDNNTASVTTAITGIVTAVTVESIAAASGHNPYGLVAVAVGAVLLAGATVVRRRNR